MYDYFSEIRFSIARVIEKQKNITLSKVLVSTSLQQLNLNFLDMVEVVLEVENIYCIQISNLTAVNTLEELTEYVYQNTTLTAAS